MRSFFALAGFLFLSMAIADSPADAARYARLKEQIFASNSLSTIKPALEEAVKIYAGDGDVWYRLGQARLAAKEYDPSIEALKKAMSLGAFANKFKASAMYDLACAYTLKGDRKEGFTWLRKSLDAGFRDLQHVRTDSDLEALHSDKRWEELAATKDVTKMSRDDVWRYDLWLLNREVSRIHYNAFTKFTKAEQDAWVKKLHDDIPKMTDHQIQVAFMKYMRRVNDGHSRIRLPRPPGPAVLPIEIFWFEEGMYVISADPTLKDLLGAKVLKVSGKPVEDLAATFNEIAPQDNSQGLRAISPGYIVIPAVLNGLGLIPDKDEVDLTILDASGSTRTVVIKGVVNPDKTKWVTHHDYKATESPLYTKHLDKPYWFEPLPDQKAVYMQYNAVRNDPKEDTQHFADRLFDYIEKNDVDKLIVDVRWNGGGNSFLNIPLVNGIIGCKKIQAHGHLFVITGRNTFSAAQNFTTDIGRACDPIYVGEPTGSSPNFVGETVAFSLPYSKMEGSISDLYWQRSWPMDHRTWIAPDLPAAPSFEVYKANRDQAMEAIEAYLKG
jgi:tetratricopeptide (TPR) repeat protein